MRRFPWQAFHQRKILGSKSCKFIRIYILILKAQEYQCNNKIRTLNNLIRTVKGLNNSIVACNYS